MRVFLACVLALILASPGLGIARGHSGSTRSSGSHPERTERVRGYTKKNGKHVAPYKRAPRGQGKSKKKKKK